jgi:hypothetical protein
MKIQCFNCGKIFDEKKITILIDFGNYTDSFSGCWHVPFCDKCLKKCKGDLDKENE